MANKLTKKQKGFIEDYLKTGIGVQAALKNYDTENYNVANVIAVENLQKPIIIQAMAERLDDGLLAERHLELLNKREVIRSLDGNVVLDIGPDTPAVSKGLDMAYKLKGSYAAEKSINVNVNVDELREEIKQNLESFRANRNRTTILPQPPQVI